MRCFISEKGVLKSHLFVIHPKLMNHLHCYYLMSFNTLTCHREEEMQELNRDTSYKLAWMTGLSILICLSVAGLQMWHLKTFFEKKKLI